LAPALRGLIEASRSERGHAALASDEREFYLGVDSAAQGLLHPETLEGRPDNWLDLESHAFAEGYLTTVADIAASISGTEPPVRLPLPDLPAHYSSAQGDQSA
jgi:hypothetical protein